MGISKFNLGQSAHVMVRVNIYPDWGYSNIDVRFAKGITMDGYSGTGRVRKWVPGTRKYETQTCEDCNMGKCRRCGGDGNKPNWRISFYRHCQRPCCGLRQPPHRPRGLPQPSRLVHCMGQDFLYGRSQDC